MLFHTWTFVLFFLLAYGVYLAVKNTPMREPWLLAASYVFYGWWSPLYLLLILYSTTVDYLAVVGMARTGRRKAFLVLSIVNNLTLLGFFKYGKFAVRNVNALLMHLGVGYQVPAPDVLLPVGISFFVFQSMSYTIDYYRGRIAAEPSFIRYAAFVALFPQLVAGPIERAGNLLPQLRRAQKISLGDVADGASMFVVGLFKKVALADYLAMYVASVYDSPAGKSGSALLLAAFVFAWQIYFDFSGYTDMARGIGRMMGIRLMLNFRNPYLASSLGDFWRRWHISLSTWFKDYVYVPLGGNRRGTLFTYRNMVLTMLISGLWHGAVWTFVLWGAWHAMGRVLTRRLEDTDFYRLRVPGLVKQVLVFAFVAFGWIFFAAHNVTDAWVIVRGIFTMPWADPKCPVMILVLIALVWAYQFTYESRAKRVLELAPVRIGLVAAMLVYLAVVSGQSQPFIYFRF